MTTNSDQVIEAWKEELKVSGYEPPKLNRWSRIRFAILPRVWRIILSKTGFKRFKNIRILEFGCGGGKQIIPLFVNGWSCLGVDCSEEVLNRARLYVNQVKKRITNCRGKIDFLCEDFLALTISDRRFDLVVQFGVLEHFLSKSERLKYLEKMFNLTETGGYVVSVVPNGEHPMRHIQRKENLGGYSIPEIDYTRDLIKDELSTCGGKNIKIIPLNLFGYLLIKNSKRLTKILNRGLYFIMQLPIFRLLPVSFLKTHSYWWIAIAKK